MNDNLFDVSQMLCSVHNWKQFIFIRESMSKLLEQPRPISLPTETRTKIGFRNKPLTIRNLYQQYSYTQRNTKEQRSVSPDNTRNFQSAQNPQKGSSSIMGHTCSNFMRNYIDKLKKQRKRERKKVDQWNHSKHLQIDQTEELASLPSIPHSKAKILAARKIYPLPFQAKPPQVTSTPQSPQIEQLVSMIKEMKQERSHRHRRNFSQGLPTLSRGKKQQRIEVLPWENVVDYQQLAFEQYK